MRAFDPEVVDAVWAAIEPLLPGVRRRPASARVSSATGPGPGLLRGDPDPARDRLLVGRCRSGCSATGVGHDAARASRRVDRRRRVRHARRRGDRRATTGSSGSTSASARSMAASTRHPPVVKAPARTPSIEASSAGSGRCSRTATASRSAGPPTARTATTACCSRPRSTTVAAPRAARPTSRRCTSTAATTTASSASSSPTFGIDDLVCANVRARRAPRPPRSSCHSGCAGRSNGPTAGCRTSGSSAATPTGAPTTDSPNSPSPIVLLLTAKLIDWRNRWNPT